MSVSVCEMFGVGHGRSIDRKGFKVGSAPSGDLEAEKGQGWSRA